MVAQVVPVSSSATAEAVKLTENIFRSVNIALVNELGRLRPVSMLALGGCFTLAGRSVFANDVRAGVLSFHPVPASSPRLQTVLVCKRGKTQQDVPAAFVRYAKGMAA